MSNQPIGIVRLVLSIMALVVSSWALIHLLSIFGVFLAITYPAWWLFTPKRTVCLLCKAKNTDESCHFCTKQSSLPSALINGGIILLCTFISIGIVYAESQILFKLGFPPTPKTATFTIPSKGQFNLGEIFPMKMELDNLQGSINAVQADIGFDPDKVEVVDVSTADSFANIFIQKEINNTGGWFRLTGGLPNPGFLGNHGTYGTIFFRAKSPGLVKIGFLSSSMVLANDGRGTNVLKDLPSVSYLILPERITEEAERQQQHLITTTDVLGTSTPSGQLKFFEDGSVLSSQAAREIEEHKSFNFTETFLSATESVDRFTLGFWEKILGR